MNVIMNDTLQFIYYLTIDLNHWYSIASTELHIQHNCDGLQRKQSYLHLKFDLNFGLSTHFDYNTIYAKIPYTENWIALTEKEISGSMHHNVYFMYIDKTYFLSPGRIYEMMRILGDEG